MKTYLIVYLGSAVLALVITPATVYLSRSIQALDYPGVRRTHARPIPRIGGMAVIVSTMGFVLPVLFLHNAVGDAFREVILQIVALLSAASLIFLVGLVDDLRGLRARAKLVAELIIAIVLCAVGIRITSVAVADVLTIEFGWFSWPLTVLWITGITNAVNLSDGLDGLAAGISAVACGVIALLAIWSGQAVMAILMLALLGSLTGFLVFNFNPARVFLGDCGSLFLGFTIATSSVMCSTKSHTLVGLALPFLALGVPIFDTLSAILRRFLERRSLFAPDRRHFHHRLLDLGLKQRHVVIISYVITLLAAGMGLFMTLTRNTGSLVLFFSILLLLLLVFRVVGLVRLGESIGRLQQKYAISRQIGQETKAFEEVQLHFRQAENFEQWWRAVCTAAKKLDFVKVSLHLNGNNKVVRKLTFQDDRHDVGSSSTEVIRLTIPIKRSPNGSRMSLKADVSANESLESAGRRAALFSRLIEEQHGASSRDTRKNMSPVHSSG
jgi:UDP-GlcNAc:undecaprenyl-phosphate GlcNAc-1-phosphate transferase